MAADAGLTASAATVTGYITDNLPTIMGVTAAFVGGKVLIGFVRGLGRNRV